MFETACISKKWTIFFSSGGGMGVWGSLFLTFFFASPIGCAHLKATANSSFSCGTR